MILFPNAKINLGLRVLRRRPDGYHDLMTVMVPTAWTDVLEIVPAASGRASLTVTGRKVDCPPEKNLVMKALRALEAETGRELPAEMYLEKIIPDGAGLGGGSADAAFALRGLNEVFALGLEPEALARVAARVGADCPFFIHNVPAFCTGTGTTLSADIHYDFSHLTLAIAKPRSASVSTAEAYAAIRPREDSPAPIDVLGLDMSLWPDLLVNDFEASIFPAHPEIKAVKDHFYTYGARYSAMSGSGAAVFALFESASLAHRALSALSGCDTFAAPGRDW